MTANNGKTAPYLAIALITSLMATTAIADNLPFPETEEEWTSALARPEYKGFDPCSNQTKGICRADDYHPTAAALVHFSFDSDTVGSQYNDRLNKLGRALQNKLHDAVLLIKGHTDSTGSDKYNQDLSVRRAIAVREYLINRFNVALSRIEITGLGEKVPLSYADNSTEAGRQLNRRVEFNRIGTLIN